MLCIVVVYFALSWLPLYVIRLKSFYGYSKWHFGWFMCKATPYLQGVCASVNTLAAIAVDRYLAICHYMEVKISKQTCKIILLCIWIVATSITIPWAIYYQIGIYTTNVQTLVLCGETWPNGGKGKHFYFLGAIFLCCYSVPLVLIVACYFLIAVRVWRRRAPGEKISSSTGVQKSKVKVMLCIVVILFAFSWLPLYAIRLKSFYGSSSDKDTERIILYIINPIAQWL
ncbi:SIFAR-like protein [Mya arenaria]|uniref:SIFAR-like protein n=1 Tax=Mya arenaria TaxID=6604 RepID=A0ABY7DHS8_MYAAR|nr:SIFAR-like protein [Mya arenaria]